MAHRQARLHVRFRQIRCDDRLQQNRHRQSRFARRVLNSVSGTFSGHAGLSDECPLLGGRTDVELSPLAGIRAGILCRMSFRDAKRLRMAGASDRPAQAPISLSAAVSYLRAWI